MKISAINTINFVKSFTASKNENITGPFIPHNQAGDTFVSQFAVENEIAQKIFNSTKKFSIKNYGNLSEKELEALRNVCKKDIDTSYVAEDNLNTALNLKTYLDEKYGKDKYVFVSIGRSPAGLARVLEFMGIETKYLPISGLRDFTCVSAVMRRLNGFDEYGDFLKDQGITNEEISDSDKSYLFYDFTHSGRTLEFFKNILTKRYKIKQHNMYFLSLNDDLIKASKNNYESLKNNEEYINVYLFASRIAQYTGLTELDVKNLFRINGIKNFQSDEAKKFNFLIIDNLNKLGLLKENPKNKKSL